MSKNEGMVDRVVRIILGLILIGLAVTGRWSPWGWIGIAPLLTGIFGFCGLYQLLGIKTCPVSTKKQP
ncbi:MAG: YgaP family membrane protein [Acidiferrobacter sp.]